MSAKELPLKELSIRQIFHDEQVVYEIPIYQRNYAWGKEEISALIQDVYDAMSKKKNCYYIGTLVSYHKGDQTYEIIDGQQRLTTLYLVLQALGIEIHNRLTYRARKKSIDTLKSIPTFHIEEKDMGIYSGFHYAQASIDSIVGGQKEEFIHYLLDKVHIVHYLVPKDVDLNHYFEVMNSRGEQLEKHEIVKANLLDIVKEEHDRQKLNYIWEACSEMSVYVQDKYRDSRVFGSNMSWLNPLSFDELPDVSDNENLQRKTIREILSDQEISSNGQSDEFGRADSFQPIIDFPNFLLIVLKLTKILEYPDTFDPLAFNLDDKELIHEFAKEKNAFTPDFVKKIGYNLLRAKFFLDNYIVHHSNEEDTVESNPWKLQCLYKEKTSKKAYLKNLCEDEDVQDKLVQLLSMFEVSFTARQRKNYLFYCLLYLFQNADSKQSFCKKYCKFLDSLAYKYFKDVYLVRECLNEINTPLPGSFDKQILQNGTVNTAIISNATDFVEIYGDGSVPSKGIPLFIFNYLDYRIWCHYLPLRGNGSRATTAERKAFFEKLGCSDFGLEVFRQFYFSRTRRSLEHYYPQADIEKAPDYLTKSQINCLGNYAMIGAEINSSGSNHTPYVKLTHYVGDKLSGKIKHVAVASLKFMVMMQMCGDNRSFREPGSEWRQEEIFKHQKIMLKFLR